MASYYDLKGTTELSFQIGKKGPKFVNASGVLQAKTAAGAFADFLGNLLSANDNLVLNANATLTGVDWKMTIARPASGMAANVTYTMPAAPVAGQFLTSDVNGNLSFAPFVADTGDLKIASKAIAYTDHTAPVNHINLPANAIVAKTEIILDTPWNIADAVISVGKAGTVNKYLDGYECDLNGTIKDTYAAQKGNPASGATEQIIVTLIDGATPAIAGACRVLVYYSVPEII